MRSIFKLTSILSIVLFITCNMVPVSASNGSEDVVHLSMKLNGFLEINLPPADGDGVILIPSFDLNFFRVYTSEDGHWAVKGLKKGESTIIFQWMTHDEEIMRTMEYCIKIQ